MQSIKGRAWDRTCIDDHVGIRLSYVHAQDWLEAHVVALLCMDELYKNAVNWEAKVEELQREVREKESEVERRKRDYRTLEQIASGWSETCKYSDFLRYKKRRLSWVR